MNLKEKVKEIIDINQGLAEELMEVSCQGYADIFSEKFFGDIDLVFVEHYGGEAMGSEYYSVIRFTCDNETVLAKFSGLYQSHYGTDYIRWRFVEPVTKTITVYE